MEGKILSSPDQTTGGFNDITCDISTALCKETACRAAEYKSVGEYTSSTVVLGGVPLGYHQAIHMEMEEGLVSGGRTGGKLGV